MFLEETHSRRSTKKRGGRRGAAEEKEHRSIEKRKERRGNAARAFTLRAFHCPAPGASAQDSKGSHRLRRGIGELERRRGGGGSRWDGDALARFGSFLFSFFLPSPLPPSNRNLDLDLDLGLFFLSFLSLTYAFLLLISSPPTFLHQSQPGVQR